MLDHRDRLGWSAEGVRGVELLQAVAGDFDDRVARDRQARCVPAAGADQHDRVRAPEARGFRPRFLGVLLAAVGAQHEDVAGGGQRVAGRVEHTGDVARQRGPLEVRGDEEQHEREHEPADEQRKQAEHDAPGGEPAPPPCGGPPCARGSLCAIAPFAQQRPRAARRGGLHRAAVPTAARRQQSAARTVAGVLRLTLRLGWTGPGPGLRARGGPRGCRGSARSARGRAL